jgi:hypothetical protein
MFKINIPRIKLIQPVKIKSFKKDTYSKNKETNYVILVKWAGNNKYNKEFTGTENQCDKYIKDLEKDLKDSNDEETDIRIISVDRYKWESKNASPKWISEY